MSWVRGPWWDGCWLLSGLPVGLVATALWLGGVPYFWMLAFGVVVFQTAHTISPIALAWLHTGFRKLMLGRPIKFIALPLGLIVIWTLAGYVGGWYWPQPSFNPVTLKIDMSSRWEPLWIMGAVYAIWNIYHFGKQNFGVMSVYRRKAGGYRPAQRRFDLVFCCLTAWGTMAVAAIHLLANYLRVDLLRYRNVLAAYVVVAIASAGIMLWRERSQFCLPRIILILTNAVGMGTAMFWWLGGLGIVSMNHWLTAIGLAGHAQKRPIVFPLAILLVGGALFCALFVRGWEIPTQVAAAAIAFRLALGTVHFLYDRWVWKLSDPQVRATIGENLLKQREAAPCEQMAQAGAL